MFVLLGASIFLNIYIFSSSSEILNFGWSWLDCVVFLVFLVVPVFPVRRGRDVSDKVLRPSPPSPPSLSNSDVVRRGRVLGQTNK